MHNSYWEESWLRLKQNRIAFFALVILFSLLVLSLIAPLLSPYTYYETHLSLANRPPCSSFWFGTDDLGRDVFTRVSWGVRISFFLGITATLIDLVVGVSVGALAAWYGARFDEALMRFADILYSLPHLLMVILLTIVMGQGLTSILLALTFTGWVPMARITRGQLLLLKEMDYVTAARSLGASSFRIILRHLVPNAIGPILTTMTFTIPSAIFSEAFLSFLGLGVQAPIASLGTMASDGLAALSFYPWRLFFPAGFICAIMFCFNTIGDALRDAFDPRTAKHASYREKRGP